MASEPRVPDLAVELTLSAATAAPRDTLEVAIRNTGRVPCWFGAGYELQQRDEDGATWQKVERERFGLMVLYSLEPGASLPMRVVVPRRARPGRHRVVKEVTGEAPRRTVRASVEFDVVARRRQ